MSILLTGASGWLGRNAIYAISQNPSLSVDLKTYASSGKTVYLRDFDGEGEDSYYCKDLVNAKRYGPYSGILHCAFLSRRFIHDYGKENYIKTVRAIDSHVLELIQKNPKVPVVLISSGVCSSSEAQEEGTDDLYTRMKFAQEHIFMQLAESRPVTILRLYAATGLFLDLSSNYALSSFIRQAHQDSVIKIHSQNLVIRSYCYLPSLMELAVKLLIDPGREKGLEIADACSIDVEIREIAEMVSQYVGGCEISDQLLTTTSESYCGNSDRFYELCQNHSVNIPSFLTQVENSIRLAGGYRTSSSISF